MNELCSVSWCDREVTAKGLCAGHYGRKAKGRNMDAPFRIWGRRIDRLRFLYGAFQHNSDECLIWPFSKTEAGYPIFDTIKGWAGETAMAHRLVCEMRAGRRLRGRNDANPEVVMHTCDTPSCINPAHLLVGTDADNLWDCREKDRHSRGERNGHSRITDEDVLTIRALKASGAATTKQLATRYGLNERHVRFIVSGGCWKHLLIDEGAAINRMAA